MNDRAKKLLIAPPDDFLSLEKEGGEERSISMIVVWITTIIAIINRIFGRSFACLWFDGVSVTCQRIREHRTTSLALEYLYLKKNDDTTWIGRQAIAYWHQLRNAQAVIHRLNITIKCLKQAVLKMEKTEIVILSVASGSAEGVLRTALWAKNQGVTIQIYLLDKDPAALERAQKRAAAMGIKDCLQCFHQDVRQLDFVLQKIPTPNIVEMVGFLDYRTDEKLVQLVQKLHRALGDKGSLITAQIAPNSERWFVHHVLGWWMIYRTPEQFLVLLQQAGFKQIELELDPWRIHAVATCAKN